MWGKDGVQCGQVVGVGGNGYGLAELLKLGTAPLMAIDLLAFPQALRDGRSKLSPTRAVSHNNTITTK